MTPVAENFLLNCDKKFAAASRRTASALVPSESCETAAQSFEKRGLVHTTNMFRRA